MYQSQDFQIMKGHKVPLFGLTLEPSIQTQIINKMNILKEKCPLHAFVHLNFEKIEAEFKAILKIEFNEIRITANASSTDPYQAFLEAQEVIEAELLLWKKKRFN